MHPTTAIQVTATVILIILLAGSAFLLKKPYRNFVWITAGLIAISSLAYFSSRPFIVESQQANAIEKLDSYLAETFPGEEWGITDTDAQELQSVIELHVIFNNEPAMVYGYEISESAIEQLDAWGLYTGEAHEDLLKRGIELHHLE